MGLFGKLLRVKTLLLFGIVAGMCVSIYYFAISRTWAGRGVLVAVDPELSFPDDQSVKTGDRDVDGYPPEQYGGGIKGDPPDGRKPLAEGGGGGGKKGKNVKDKGDSSPSVGVMKRGEVGGGGGGDDEDDREGAERPVEDLDDSAIFISQLTEAGMTGMLNYDVWRWIVGYTVDDMRIDKSFPNFPNERKTITKLHTEFNEADPEDLKGKYSHRVYGYLLPPLLGEYKFSVEMSDITAAGCVELWLSTDRNPLNMRKILVLDYDDMSRPMPRRATYKRAESQPVRMDSRVHYFEYLQKVYEGKAIIDIKWKQPHSEGFVGLDFRLFAMAAKFNSEGQLTYGPHVKVIQGRLPNSALQTHRRTQFVGDTIYPITDLDVLPQCEFKAAYAKPRKVKRYEAVYQIHESKVYPKDETWFKTWHRKDKGNVEIDKGTVDKVISLYTKALNSSTKYKGQVQKLRFMEETVNKNIATKKNKNPEVFGSRFLVEFDIELEEPDSKLVHTSEYVYLPKNSDDLCYTSNFQWRKSPIVDVYFIVSLKNLGVWVDHLIQNMEELYAATKDEHFELVIVDYESQDMDIEEKIKHSSVNRWHVIKKHGAFSRSSGLQAGIDYVTNPDSIVMTIDMHLTLPTGFVEYVRKHTIQGKMACTPFFFRLNKGYTEINFNGFWETLTYGLFALYKSDWTEFGGFDLRRYKDKWGGEDWDILDRSSALGREAFRIRYPGLVHYYHTKAGMWTGGDAKGKPKK